MACMVIEEYHGLSHCEYTDGFFLAEDATSQQHNQDHRMLLYGEESNAGASRYSSIFCKS